MKCNGPGFSWRFDCNLTCASESLLAGNRANVGIPRHLKVYPVDVRGGNVRAYTRWAGDDADRYR